MKRKMSRFLVGIENLDTSHVEDMNSMFYFSKDGTKEFDLGDEFDTSHVKDITAMFLGDGSKQFEKNSDWVLNLTFQR